MKKFTVKNYKGNLLESVKKFQEEHKNMRIVEAFEEQDLLRLAAEPLPPESVLHNEFPEDTQPPPESVEQDTAAAAEVPDILDPIFAFGSKLLMFGIQVHYWHLNCSRNSEHLALKELYEACDDVGDRLLEAAIGFTGKPTPQPSFDGLNVSFTPDSVERIVEIRNEANDLTRRIDIDSGIDNILGDFCETCNSVVYKLKRLV